MWIRLSSLGKIVRLILPPLFAVPRFPHKDKQAFTLHFRNHILTLVTALSRNAHLTHGSRGRPNDPPNPHLPSRPQRLVSPPHPRSRKIQRGQNPRS